MAPKGRTTMPEAGGFCLLLSSRWHCVWPVPLTQHANLPVLCSAICLKNRFELIYLWPRGSVPNRTRSKQQFLRLVGFCLLLSSRWHCVWPVPLTQHAMRPSCSQPSVSKTALNSFTSGRVDPFPMEQGANNNGLRLLVFAGS